MKLHIHGSKARSVQDSNTLASLERNFCLLAHAAANLASFCEHVEHNEPIQVADATDASASLRCIALDLCITSGISLVEAYATRIREIEETSLLQYSLFSNGASRLSGADVLDSATTWKQIQVGQLIHDRQFHPDVFGLAKLDQIRHYTFHVTKLVGLFLSCIEKDTWVSFQNDRLADIAIFGVKLATVCNVELPNTAVDIK